MEAKQIMISDNIINSFIKTLHKYQVKFKLQYQATEPNYLKIKNMKATLLKISAFVLLFVLMGAGCVKDKKVQTKNPGEFEGYIAGFQPCDFYHHYQIGYVIISTDLKDTLITYSLSDKTQKMPSSVLLSSPDTLYKIPESCFKNSFGFIFQGSSRYEYKIKGTYRDAEHDEIIGNICTNDILLNFTQIIITSVSK